MLSDCLPCKGNMNYFDYHFILWYKLQFSTPAELSPIPILKVHILNGISTVKLMYLVDGHRNSPIFHNWTRELDDILKEWNILFIGGYYTNFKTLSFTRQLIRVDEYKEGFKSKVTTVIRKGFNLSFLFLSSTEYLIIFT